MARPGRLIRFLYGVLLSSYRALQALHQVGSFLCKAAKAHMWSANGWRQMEYFRLLGHPSHHQSSIHHHQSAAKIPHLKSFVAPSHPCAGPGLAMVQFSLARSHGRGAKNRAPSRLVLPRCFLLLPPASFPGRSSSHRPIAALLLSLTSLLFWSSLLFFRTDSDLFSFLYPAFYFLLLY